MVDLEVTTPDMPFKKCLDKTGNYFVMTLKQGSTARKVYFEQYEEMALNMKRINMFMGHGQARSDLFTPEQGLRSVTVGLIGSAERLIVKHKVSGRQFLMKVFDYAESESQNRAIRQHYKLVAKCRNSDSTPSLCDAF